MEPSGLPDVPVLKAKLIAPEPPATALFTERMRRLGIARHRCTLITAPAGYGKTTAALLSLRGLGARVCWYRLEQEDGRVQVFAAHLVGTLFQGADGGRLQSADFLSRAAGDFSLFHPALCHDAWAHFGGDARQALVCLVLDNFHHAAHQGEIVQCVRYMLSNMPPCVRIVVTSRERTGLEAASGPAGDVAVIGMDALRFTQDETRAYCREKLGIAAEDAAFRRIHELSEGWVAGIAMMMLAFKASGGAHLGSFLDGGVGGGAPFDGLIAQALRQEDGEALRALMRLALLEDFRPEEAAGIFGIDGAEQAIEALAARNLYLTRTVTGGGAVFRFHSLYRNALTALARETFGPGGVRALHRKIAGYYCDAGALDRAVRHYLAAGDAEAAAGVIRLNADRLINDGAAEAVKTLIECFPGAYRESHPHLLLYDGLTNKRQDFARAIRCLEKARALFEAEGNHPMRIRACLSLMMASVYQNRLDIVERVAGELEAIPGARQDPLCRRSMMLLALSRATLGENFPEGNALFAALRGGDLSQEERCGAYLYGCALRHRQGDLDGALGLMEQPLASTLGRLDLYWRSFALSLRSRVLLLKGDFQAAQESARELLELGERYAHPYSGANGRYYLALIQYLTHGAQGAIQTMCAAQRDYLSFENGARAALCRLHHYLWLCGTGDAPEPAQILGAYHALTAMRPAQGDDDLAAALAGAALRERGECEEAEKLLLLSCERSAGKGAPQSAAGAALHLSKLYFDMGIPEKGFSHLRQALLVCAENGYTVVYDMHFPTLIALCARAAGAGIQAAHVRAMLLKYFDASAVNRLMARAGDFYSDKAAQKFLHQCARARQAPRRDVEVQLFGGLKITAGAVTLDEGAFKTRKTSGIVKYLLLNRGQHCSRERLAAVFWPDTGKKAAFNSLRVALCEIRKALSAAGISFEDAAPLISEDEHGLRISKKSCSTDTDAFEALFQSLKAADPRSERAQLSQMITLYRDGLLPMDLYEDYAAVDREHFQAMFLEAAHRMAALMMSDRDVEAAEALLLRIVKLDPVDEAAHAALTALYRDTGRQHMADALSREFKRRCEREAR